jgi:chromosome segregation ATPase
MDVEKTIQFLVETAAQHDARMAELEKGMLDVKQALLFLVENQVKLQSSIESLKSSVEETRGSLRELGEKTDQRIGNLVSAIGKLAEQRPDGRSVQ